MQPEELINVESSDEPEHKAVTFDGIVGANKGEIRRVNIKKLKPSTCWKYAEKYVKKVV